MAPSQSALYELLDAIRAGDDEDVLRQAMALVLHELIELEASHMIGAGGHERSDELTTQRNGSRSRLAGHGPRTKLPRKRRRGSAARSW